MAEKRKTNKKEKKDACDRCGAKSAYFRPYSGESLCAPCFSKSLREKVAKTISKYRMVRYGDRIAVAVSGGKDSLSLLHIMKTLCGGHGSTLHAVTIDEGIGGGYREESLEIVRGFASRLGVEHTILSYNELFGMTLEEGLELRKKESGGSGGSGGSKKMSSCSLCGTFRRRAIDTVAESVGANVVATAHNLDDFLQTFLINVFAGDLERIGWTYPEPVAYANGLRKIKPVTEIYEHEIAFYALVNDMPFQAEECPHMNEGMRTDVREFLNRQERAHAGIKYNAYNTAVKVAKRLRDSAGRERARCAVCGRDSSGEICSVCKTVITLKQ
ncbi:MAG: TIGR00269 family protein [Nitrososphaerales archaeon]